VAFGALFQQDQEELLLLDGQASPLPETPPRGQGGWAIAAGASQPLADGRRRNAESLGDQLVAPALEVQVPRSPSAPLGPRERGCEACLGHPQVYPATRTSSIKLSVITSITVHMWCTGERAVGRAIAPPQGTRLHEQGRSPRERPPAGGLEGGNRRHQPARPPAGGLSRMRLLRVEPRPLGRGDPTASRGGIVALHLRGRQQAALSRGLRSCSWSLVPRGGATLPATRPLSLDKQGRFRDQPTRLQPGAPASGAHGLWLAGLEAEVLGD
jgi:hypothetical protein